MDMKQKKTTIPISIRNRDKLERYKRKLNVKTYDDTLDKLFLLINKLKLQKELEDLDG